VNAEVVNRFLGATKTVLTEYFNITIDSTGTPLALQPSSAFEPITVVLELLGDLEGQFLLAYSNEVALETARAMMYNPEYPAFDDLCKSALAELGNMIAGMTSTALAEMGFMCELAPPIVVIGKNVHISLAVPVVIALPLKASVGDFRVCVALKPGDSK
jgi:chemotaxis protein CheX